MIVGYYNPGSNAVGQKAYSGLLLFKMLLLGIWYDLSDERVEEMVNENLSAMVFCGLHLEDRVPSHGILSRFRTALTKTGGFEALFHQINSQLQSKGVMVQGVGHGKGRCEPDGLSMKIKGQVELLDC